MSNKELERVASRIEPAIRSFCKSRLTTNPIFLMKEMVNYVTSYPDIECAPSSPDRILRKMQSEGKVDYLVVNRSKSLYRIQAVA